MSKHSIFSEDHEIVSNENGEIVEEPQVKEKKSMWKNMKPKRGGPGAKNKQKGGAKKPQPAPQPQQQVVKQTDAVVAKEPKISEKAKESESEAESGEESDNEEKEEMSTDDEKKEQVEWEKIQQKLNKREKLEGKSKVSHSVHSPGFPEDKQEYWWTYICDRKSRTLLTAPYHVTNLVDTEEIQLKFTAPRWPAVYTFAVCLRSGKLFQSHTTVTTVKVKLFFLLSFATDSYMGMDQQQELKLDVKEAPAVPTDHPQWDLSESESEKEDPQANESEFTTDTSDDEE